MAAITQVHHSIRDDAEQVYLLPFLSRKYFYGNSLTLISFVLAVNSYKIDATIYCTKRLCVSDACTMQYEPRSGLSR